MENRVAVLAIIVEKLSSVNQLNEYLHENTRHIIGRMGLPYRQKDLHIISIAMDAPQDVICDLTKKISTLDGVKVEAVYSPKCEK